MTPSGWSTTVLNTYKIRQLRDSGKWNGKRRLQGTHLRWHLAGDQLRDLVRLLDYVVSRKSKSKRDETWSA